MTRLPSSATFQLSAFLAASLISLAFFALPVAPARAAACAFPTTGQVSYFRDGGCDRCPALSIDAACFCQFPDSASVRPTLCRGETTLYSRGCIPSNARYGAGPETLDLGGALQNNCAARCNAIGQEPLQVGTQGGLVTKQQDNQFCWFREAEECKKANSVFGDCTKPTQGGPGNEHAPYLDHCFCAARSSGSGIACHMQSTYLKPTFSEANQCGYFCDESGLTFGRAELGHKDARCDIRPETQCTTASNDKTSSACQRCICRFNKKFPTASCHGKTTLGGYYDTFAAGSYNAGINPPTAESYCTSLCEQKGESYDFDSVAAGAEDYCYYGAADGCAQPLGGSTEACGEVAGRVAGTAAELAKGTAISLPLPLGDISVPKAFGRMINGILSVVGSISLLMFVYGGIRWMTAAGNPEQVKGAKQTIVYAVLGLVAIFGAYVIIGFLISNFG